MIPLKVDSNQKSANLNNEKELFNNSKFIENREPITCIYLKILITQIITTKFFF